MKKLLFVLPVVVFLAAGCGGSQPQPMSQQSAPAATTNQTNAASDISNSTGLSQDDVSGSMSIVDRYQLDSASSAVVAKDAAYLYSMESSGQYSAVLQKAGLGSLDDIADVLAHLIKVWNVPDADVSHSLDVVFNGLTKSTFAWSDYTNTLIANGPKMRDYVSLVDSASSLAGLQMNVDTTSAAIDMFNTVGDNLENPKSQLNMAMGGTGYIRTIVKQDGLVGAIQKISAFVQKKS